MEITGERTKTVNENNKIIIKNVKLQTKFTVTGNAMNATREWHAHTKTKPYSQLFTNFKMELSMRVQVIFLQDTRCYALTMAYCTFSFLLYSNYVHSSVSLSPHPL